MFSYNRWAKALSIYYKCNMIKSQPNLCKKKYLRKFRAMYKISSTIENAVCGDQGWTSGDRIEEL